MSVPTIFDEYFKNTIKKLCEKMTVQSNHIIHSIPNLKSKDQITSKVQHLNLLFNSVKKELNENFVLLFNMTHSDDETKIIRPKKKLIKKKRNKRHPKPRQ